MPTETNPGNQTTTGADAIDEAIAQGIDFDGSPHSTCQARTLW
ncbi:hypothetical protein ANSO36C_15850 [Nostoc cf. commune SO-36]|uniref:Uncharacterized protein n=1 Tax=Nostoc cf. commune SO-36 TaxID=449208 RepID=A0ABN6Q356_NOSCO|nr:hypothetical protein ANSO36C_15850 [Nostoc cf. commune SO-36]